MVHDLAKDPQKLKTYNDVIVEQERRGFIERVVCPEVARGKCRYLPHHDVLRNLVLHQYALRMAVAAKNPKLTQV